MTTALKNIAVLTTIAWGASTAEGQCRDYVEAFLAPQVAPFNKNIDVHLTGDQSPLGFAYGRGQDKVVVPHVHRITGGSHDRPELRKLYVKFRLVMIEHHEAMTSMAKDKPEHLGDSGKQFLEMFDAVQKYGEVRYEDPTQGSVGEYTKPSFTLKTKEGTIVAWLSKVDGENIVERINWPNGVTSDRLPLGLVTAPVVKMTKKFRESIGPDKAPLFNGHIKEFDVGYPVGGKTYFPDSWSLDKIKLAAAVALARDPNHPAIVEGKGYVFAEVFGVSIGVALQGGEVTSVFPTWIQPYSK